MEIIKVKNYRKLAKKASEIILGEIAKKPNLTLGLASGITTLGLYKELRKAYRRKKVSFSKVKCFNIDEYHPIEKQNPNSFFHYFHKNFLDHVNVKKSNINLLEGGANPEKESRAVESRIRKNPADVMILGIGVNGHIAFNEPGSSPDSRTRQIKLSSETIKSNSKYFRKSEMPKHAITIGVKTIMSSKKIILLASGKSKAAAIKGLVKGRISRSCPASFLRKHRDFTLIVDSKAASMLG